MAVVKTSACPHCRRAEAALREAGIAFVEIDASDADGVVRDAATAVSGMRTVPQVFVGGACGAVRTIRRRDRVGELARQSSAPRPTRGTRRRRHSPARRPGSGGSGRRRPSRAEGVAAFWFRLRADAAYAILMKPRSRERDLLPGDRWTFGGWRCPLKLSAAWSPTRTSRWIARDERTRRAFAGRSTSDERNDDAGTIAQIASRMCELGLLASADGSRALDERVVRDEDGAGSIPSGSPTSCGAVGVRHRRRRAQRAAASRPPRDARGGRGPRERILRLHDEFLSDDGAFVDYEGVFVGRLPRARGEALQAVSLSALTNEKRRRSS